MKKKPNLLAVWCCVGILLGFLARFVIPSVPPNRLIPCGMILGLGIGLLFQKLSGNKK